MKGMGERTVQSGNFPDYPCFFLLSCFIPLIPFIPVKFVFAFGLRPLGAALQGFRVPSVFALGRRQWLPPSLFELWRDKMPSQVSFAVAGIGHWTMFIRWTRLR